jgi:predicted metalloprotease
MTHAEFVQYVVNDASAKWQGTLANAGIPYSPTGAVTDDEPIDTGCGTADSSTGPFYCPPDETIYWPTDTVIPRSGKPLAEYGDFAVAVAAAHEVGHHVQNELGILEAEAAGQLDTLSLQTELQADCFAGVWGYSAYYEGLVESGDMDEAMSLIPDLGDLPEQPRGEPYAHGSPEERVEAFLTGYDYGDPVRCLDYTPVSEETTG